MITLKHSRLAIAHLIVVVIGIFGLTFGVDHISSTQNRLIAASVVCLIIAIFIFEREKRVRVFKRQSNKLAKFFSRWYSKKGMLCVFCTNLNWISELNPDASDRLISALILKAEQKSLQLFLLDMNDTHSTRLRDAGAQIYKILPHMSEDHRFSVLKNDGINYLICRSKTLEASEAGKEKVEFIDTSSSKEPYLVRLAMDLLETCREQT